MRWPRREEEEGCEEEEAAPDRAAADARREVPDCRSARARDADEAEEAVPGEERARRGMLDGSRPELEKEGILEEMGAVKRQRPSATL